jgi:hypothetical protein
MIFSGITASSLQTQSIHDMLRPPPDGKKNETRSC